MLGFKLQVIYDQMVESKIQSLPSQNLLAHSLDIP